MAVPALQIISAFIDHSQITTIIVDPIVKKQHKSTIFIVTGIWRGGRRVEKTLCHGAAALGFGVIRAGFGLPTFFHRRRFAIGYAREQREAFVLYVQYLAQQQIEATGLITDFRFVRAIAMANWSGTPHTQTSLAHELGAARTSQDRALRRLRDAGLVKIERRGRQTFLVMGESEWRTFEALTDRMMDELLDTADRIRNLAK